MSGGSLNPLSGRESVNVARDFMTWYDKLCFYESESKTEIEVALRPSCDATMRT